MRKLFLFLIIAASAGALAQSYSDIAEDAHRLAEEIRRESHRLTSAQRSEISYKFQEIRAVLDGGGNPYPGGAYSCTSRDNDGMSPYVVAYRDGINLVRISGTSFRSRTECEDTLRSRRQFGNLDLFCGSRDGDGMNPYAFFALNGSRPLTRLNFTTTRDLTSCNDLLNQMVPGNYGRSILYCASRDNDGMNPYSAFEVDTYTGAVQKGTETWSNIADCWRFVRGY